MMTSNGLSGFAASVLVLTLRGHHEWVDYETADFNLKASALYVAARAGTVNCADAFDLAALILQQYSPRSPEARRLASLSLDCESGTDLAEAALRLLEAVNFTPGFAEEPALLTRIEDAMRVVNRDVTATELPPCHLYVAEHLLTANVYVVTQDGHQGSGVGVFAASGADCLSALLAVAEDAQDAIMHSIWAAWPVCPAHDLGVHPRNHDITAVWWCPGDNGHAVSPIGELARPRWYP